LTSAACGTLGTTVSLLSDADFQKENLPGREIRVVILTADESKMPVIRKLLREASDALEEQVGMTLAEKDVRSIEWQSGDIDKMLGQMAAMMEGYNEPYDLAIAFRDFSFPKLMQYLSLGAWEGAIDDRYRRLIIIRKMDVEVLLHEICHGFLFSRIHSHGLMTPMTVYLLPGLISLNRSIYLSTKDRKEILANKWRDFSQLPDLPPEAVTNIPDPAHGLRAGVTAAGMQRSNPSRWE
jgi:hypothetical protein